MLWLINNFCLIEMSAYQTLPTLPTISTSFVEKVWDDYPRHFDDNNDLIDFYDMDNYRYHFYDMDNYRNDSDDEDPDDFFLYDIQIVKDKRQFLIEKQFFKKALLPKKRENRIRRYNNRRAKDSRRSTKSPLSKHDVLDALSPVIEDDTSDDETE